jgi:hypothetical protein
MTRRKAGQILTGVVSACAVEGADSKGWTRLFDGRTLNGWEGDSRVWSVENGAIVGSTDTHKVEQNTFLIHKDTVADFHLIAEVRLRNHNSGIQFRSQRVEGPGWIVAGYQADFSDAGDNSAWGNFYEERGRRRSVMKTNDEGWQRGKTLVRRGDWNEIQVIACGPRIEVKLNGETTVQAHDEKSPSGVLALQLHSGVPMRVEFRNMRIRRLESRKCEA